MEVTDVLFTIKDVITIVLGISSITGLYYALKKSVDAVSLNLSNLEKKQEREYNELLEEIRIEKADSLKREGAIHARMTSTQEQQRLDNEKLQGKIEILNESILSMSKNISELSGYIRAKNEK